MGTYLLLLCRYKADYSTDIVTLHLISLTYMITHTNITDIMEMFCR